MSMIRVENLSFGYRQPAELFRDFSWTVQPGERWAVIGPSGCGKTTLLYLLAGLRRPSGGTITVAGQPLVGPRLQTGLILQDYGLLPWARAWENVALGLAIRGVPRPERRRRALAWLERLGLAAVADRYPAQLSGGQRQRVAIARTLILEPDLLLLDEPFAALDALTREDLQDLLGALCAQTTMVLVTHDIAEAVFLAQRLLVLGRPPIRQGQVIENPAAGQPGYRRTVEFALRCAQVRQALERAQDRVVAEVGG